jgi:hypothetical protein
MALLAALCATDSIALADDSFRCPTGRLINVGVGLDEARGKCGAPKRSDRRVEKQRIRERGLEPVEGTPIYTEREIEVAVDEWIFDLGRDRFVRVLRFENGKLVAITTGRYGSD